MDLFRADVDVASRATVTVLIAGGSARQNECVARVVHHRGGTASGPFVTVGCASLTEAQLAPLLFHRPDDDDRGPTAVAGAAGGTLFLESIDELSLWSQMRLMRLLDDAAGPSAPPQRRGLDCRIVCSTEGVLNDAVRTGTFREDLYYRLNTVYLEVPPLTREEWESCRTTLGA